MENTLHFATPPPRRQHINFPAPAPATLFTLLITFLEGNEELKEHPQEVKSTKAVRPTNSRLWHVAGIIFLNITKIESFLQKIKNPTQKLY